MAIALVDARKIHRLSRKDPVPFFEQAGGWDVDVAPGDVVRFTAEDPCLLAHVFYVLAGVVELDHGRVSLTGAALEPAGLRPQDRASKIGVVDARSSLWWDRTLLENFAPTGVDEEAARGLLDRCGVGAALAGSTKAWSAKAREVRRVEDRALYAAAAQDPYCARPGMLGDHLVHKRAELARELAADPAWLFVLDSCDCAGQPTIAPLYPLLAEVARERGLRVVLMSRQPHDDAAVLFAGEYGVSLNDGRIALAARPPGAAPIEPVDPASRDVVLRLDDLSKRYGRTTVIDQLTFDVERGKLLVVMGGSGCGKSTLLRLVAGIVPPTTGEVWFDPLDDHMQARLGARQIVGPRRVPDASMRRLFGVLFQDGALFNSMTVAQNIAAPIREHTALHENVVEGMVQIKLRQVQMWGNDPDVPEHAGKLPRELSGGQRKRIGLARALALDPQVIFYDEPSAGLDPIVSRQIDHLMRDLGEILGVTSIVVTHELESAFEIADRMIVLRKGDEQANEYWKPARMVAQGGPEAIMGCVQPHVIDFLADWSYHHGSALERHGNWYREAFGR